MVFSFFGSFRYPFFDNSVNFFGFSGVLSGILSLITFLLLSLGLSSYWFGYSIWFHASCKSMPNSVSFSSWSFFVLFIYLFFCLSLLDVLLCYFYVWIFLISLNVKKVYTLAYENYFESKITSWCRTTKQKRRERDEEREIDNFKEV